MKRPDIEKSADELLSDSCFDSLASCNARIAETEAKLLALREAAKALKWGSAEEGVNYLAQQYAYGELLGLAYMQGGLQAHCCIKTDLAAIARRREPSGEEVAIMDET